MPVAENLPLARPSAASDDEPSPRRRWLFSNVKNLPPAECPGHEEAVNRLEEALAGDRVAVVLHHPACVGKTTAAARLLRRRHERGQLKEMPVWLCATDAVHTLQELAAAVMGPFFSLKDAQAMQALVAALRGSPRIIVMDGFDGDFGYHACRPASAVHGHWPDSVATLLRQLQGGATKVVITSRSGAGWVPEELCRRLPMPPMPQAEQMAFIGGQADADADAAGGLNPGSLLGRFVTEELQGNLVLIRSVLKALEARRKRAPDLGQLAADNRVLSAVVAPPAAVECVCPPEHRSYLVPLALMENNVDARFLHSAGRRAMPDYQPEVMESLLLSLAEAGVIAGRATASAPQGEKLEGLYGVPPALMVYLRKQVLPKVGPEVTSAWERAFVESLAAVAETFHEQPAGSQQGLMRMYQASFDIARDLAAARGLGACFATITQCLAGHALNLNHHGDATVLYAELAAHHLQTGDIPGFSSACFQLGRTAMSALDYPADEQWFLKALELDLARGDLTGAAQCCGRLAQLAHLHGREEDVCYWHARLSALHEENRNYDGLARSFEQRALMLQDNQSHEESALHFLKAFQVFVALRDEENAWKMVHSLGRLAGATRREERATVLSMCRQVLGDRLLAQMQLEEPEEPGTVVVDFLREARGIIEEFQKAVTAADRRQALHDMSDLIRSVSPDLQKILVTLCSETMDTPSLQRVLSDV